MALMAAMARVELGAEPAGGRLGAVVPAAAATPLHRHPGVSPLGRSWCAGGAEDGSVEGGIAGGRPGDLGPLPLALTCPALGGDRGPRPRLPPRAPAPSGIVVQCAICMTPTIGRPASHVRKTAATCPAVTFPERIVLSWPNLLRRSPFRADTRLCDRRRVSRGVLAAAPKTAAKDAFACAVGAMGQPALLRYLRSRRTPTQQRTVAGEGPGCRVVRGPGQASGGDEQAWRAVAVHDRPQASPWTSAARRSRPPGGTAHGSAARFWEPRTPDAAGPGHRTTWPPRATLAAVASLPTQAGGR